MTDEHGYGVLAIVIIIMLLIIIAERGYVDAYARYCAEHGSQDHYCAVKMMNAERNSIE